MGAAGPATAHEASAHQWLRLALAPGVGPVMAHQLLRAFGSPAQIFQAKENNLRAVGGIGGARIGALLNADGIKLAREEFAAAEAAGVHFIFFDDERYPISLRRLESPPLLLWARGRLAPADALSVSIVGPRRPSGYARLMARQLAGEIAARGLTVVSGLALGIDSEAHEAALEAGGRTIAVLGQGLGTAVSPKSNADLAERIVKEDRGAVLSIFPLHADGHAGNFPARNEIVAGLGLGTLVVEAGAQSGSLITARHAAEQHRPVMACPGDATRSNARGSNALIAEGAALVQNADDVLHALENDLRRVMIDLGMAQAPAEKKGQMEMDLTDGDTRTRNAGAAVEDDADDDCGPAFALPTAELSPLASAALEIMREEPQPADVLLARLGAAGHPRSAVLDQLLELELLGLAEQLPGRIYAVKKMPRRKKNI